MRLRILSVAIIFLLLSLLIPNTSDFFTVVLAQGGQIFSSLTAVDTAFT